MGGQAVQDAIAASGAIRASVEQAQAADEGVVSAVERPDATRASVEQAQAADEGVVSAVERPDATDGQDLASTGTAEVQAEGPPDLEKLPDTGGPSPWWLGAPLLCAGGLLARKILLQKPS